MANKYRAQPTIYRDVRYASKAEAARALELDQLLAANEIKWWIGQPVFRLGCGINKYVADFLVCDANGDVRVEDVKGCKTQKFLRDCRLWQAYGFLPLLILSRHGKRWKMKTVTPNCLNNEGE